MKVNKKLIFIVALFCFLLPFKVSATGYKAILDDEADLFSESEEEQLKENLESYQHRDQIKNDYCKSHNITLLRFNNLKTVEEELMKYFQEHGIIKEEGLFDLVS